MGIAHILGMAGVLVTLGDLALAHWARGGMLLFVFVGIGLNIAGIMVYAQTLGMEHVGIATAIFLGFNILAVTLGGVLVFGESIGMARVVGLFALTASIIFIEVVG